MSGIFVALDFETADAKRDSACAVALVRVEQGRFVSSRAALIKPPRPIAFHNQQVHGITNARVANARTFAELWPLLLPTLDGAEFLVAHNVAFDRSVLRACCLAAGLPEPMLPWRCSLEAARRAWPSLPSCSLDELCRTFDIPLKHHDALSDAEACADIWLRIGGGKLLRGGAPASSPTATASPTTSTAPPAPAAPLPPPAPPAEAPAAAPAPATATTTPPALAERGGHAAPAAEEPRRTAPKISPIEATEIGRQAALARNDHPVGLGNRWIDSVVVLSYQLQKLELDYLKLQKLLGLSDEDLARYLGAGDSEFVSGKRRPIVNPAACGGCGTLNLQIESRTCTRCGWQKPAGEEQAA